MEEALGELEEQGFPIYGINLISYFYAQFLEESLNGWDNSDFSLCKHHDGYDQPKGVKFKYWLGVACIAGGILIAPINPAASLGLIGFGGGIFVDAAATALDNKDNFERNLNQRQNIGPDNVPRNPPNTLPPPPQRSYFRIQRDKVDLILVT
jgi:hypothetical protein